MSLEDMGVERMFASERGPTLAAQIFELYMHFLDVSNDALPFHGGSCTAIPCTLYCQMTRPFHSMHAHVFCKIQDADVRAAWHTLADVPQTGETRACVENGAIVKVLWNATVTSTSATGSMYQKRRLTVGI
jgi:hypothetical protein